MSGAHGRRNANPSRRRAMPPGPSDAAPVRDAGRNGSGAIRTTMRPPMTNAVAMTATPWSEVAMRTASDRGGMMTSVRLCALPTKARPNPRRIGSTSLGTSESAAGSVAAMPMPWKIRATTNGPSGPPGSTPGSSRTAQPAR